MGCADGDCGTKPNEARVCGTKAGVKGEEKAHFAKRNPHADEPATYAWDGPCGTKPWGSSPTERSHLTGLLRNELDYQTKPIGQEMMATI